MKKLGISGISIIILLLLITGCNSQSTQTNVTDIKTQISTAIPVTSTSEPTAKPISLERLNYLKYIEKGMAFKCSNITIHAYVSDYKLQDVTGDKIKDDIFLVNYGGNGSRSPHGVVIIKDGVTHKYTNCDINFKFTKKDISDYGNEFKYINIFCNNLFIGDFNGDSVKDIYASFSYGDPGSSCGFDPQLFSVFSFKNNKCIWFEKENRYISKSNSKNGTTGNVAVDTNNDGVYEVVAYRITNGYESADYHPNSKKNIIFKYDPKLGVMAQQ